MHPASGRLRTQLLTRPHLEGSRSGDEGSARIPHRDGVDEPGADDLDGWAAASTCPRAAHLAGFLHGQVGRRHAHGHDHSPQARVYSAQWPRSERESHPARALHSPGQRAHMDFDRERSGLPDGAIHQEPQLLLRPGLPDGALSVLGGHRGGTAGGRDSALSPGDQSLP